MQGISMRDRAQRVSRFVIVQFIALVGWIIVQSSFSLTSLGRTIPFSVMMVVEAIWWIVTLAIMYYLFRRVYRSFAQSAFDLEDANRKLREATNQILAQVQIKDQGM